MEKIVETPHETIIIDDVTDITKIKSINDRTERITDITDITDVNTVKNTYNLHDTEENILREVVKENVLVSDRSLSIFVRSTCLFHFSRYLKIKMGDWLAYNICGGVFSHSILKNKNAEKNV